MNTDRLPTADFGFRRGIIYFEMQIQKDKRSLRTKQPRKPNSEMETSRHLNGRVCVGLSVKARCECGYEKEFLIGGGMFSSNELCLFPCLCRSCDRIVTGNLFAAQLTCPECEKETVVPYDDQSLVELRSHHIVVFWRTKHKLGRILELTNGKYYCPTCCSYRLTFEKGDICWD